MSKKAFSVVPIGYVRADRQGYRLEIDRKYLEGLQELEGFSHVQVLWWGHYCDSAEYRSGLVCDRPYKKAPARMGVFATRSPARPNPLSLSAVAVTGIEREAGLIHVPYIDAEDGTPIIDLKPYHPCLDRVRECAVPAWCRHWPQWSEDSASFDWEAEFENAR
jgi:tRNA-Thr(GGU) m(6)t(6)A37 methyltransferase TsaA